MIVASTVIATRLATKKVITSYNCVAIPSTEYTKEEAQALKRFLVDITNRVPPIVGNSTNDHIYLPKDEDTYTTKCAPSGYTQAQAPTAMTSTDGTTDTVLTQERENAVSKAKTYHTQGGSRVGLSKPNLVNFPCETIIKFVYPESKFDKTETYGLLKVIMWDAHPSTVVEVNELKEIHSAPLTFDGPKILKVQFVFWKKVTLDLKHLHQVETSWSKMMMEWLLALEKEKWQEKTASNGYVMFSAFFKTMTT
jgi:hypothetical protein